MFESITEGLNRALSALTSRGKLTPENIKDGMRQVRMALLEADVNFKVVKDFVSRVQERAVGQDVIRHVRPGQQVVKIVHDELVTLMGASDTTIRRRPDGPTVILMAGLQGSGKTTTCGKLAVLFGKRGFKPLLVAADLQRPAAVEQLRTVGQQIDVPVYVEASGARPQRVCERAVAHAAAEGLDLVILDTAGRLHVDETLMAEVREIAERVEPQEIFLVVDAMTGQDAVNSAKAFNEALEISGVILTKLDGDARGGAALSIRAVTGKPIKFVGVGEKMDRLEEFHPDRMAGRILGMGDVVSLVEKAQEVVDPAQAVAVAEKMFSGNLNLEDLLGQMQQVRRMGPLREVLGMIPGMGKLVGESFGQEEDPTRRFEAVILSMTPEERRDPDVIDGRRRRRIALGSGVTVQDVNELLKEFRQVKKMVRHAAQAGRRGQKRTRLPGFPGLPGGPRWR